MSLFLGYIDKVKEGLHRIYGCPLVDPNVGPEAGVVVSDGTYPMEIEGKMDYVQIKKGMIFCCQWEKPDEVTV